MKYSNRRKRVGGGQRRGLRIAVIIVVIGLVIALAIVSVSNWLGPFPFGINRRDTTLLTLWNEGRYEEVLEHAEQVLSGKPLDAQALTFGGFAHFYVGVDLATAADRQAHLERSILLLRKAEHVARAPLEGERRYVLGKAYYHTGPENYDLCARYMQMAVDGGYVAEDSYSYLGLAHEGMGDYVSSAGWYEAGIGLQDSATLRIKAADARLMLGDPSAAEAHLRAALGSNTDEYVELLLRVKLAAALIEKKDLVAAETLLSDLVETYPDSADANYYLGVVYDLTDRSIEARSMWRQARVIDPGHVKALESLRNWEE